MKLPKTKTPAASPLDVAPNTNKTNKTTAPLTGVKKTNVVDLVSPDGAAKVAPNSTKTQKKNPNSFNCGQGTPTKGSNQLKLMSFFGKPKASKKSTDPVATPVVAAKPADSGKSPSGAVTDVPDITKTASLADNVEPAASDAAKKATSPKKTARVKKVAKKASSTMDLTKESPSASSSSSSSSPSPSPPPPPRRPHHHHRQTSRETSRETS